MLSSYVLDGCQFIDSINDKPMLSVYAERRWPVWWLMSMWGAAALLSKFRRREIKAQRGICFTSIPLLLIRNRLIRIRLIGIRIRIRLIFFYFFFKLELD